MLPRTLAAVKYKFVPSARSVVVLPLNVALLSRLNTPVDPLYSIGETLLNAARISFTLVAVLSPTVISLTVSLTVILLVVSSTVIVFSIKVTFMFAMLCSPYSTVNATKFASFLGSPGTLPI